MRLRRQRLRGERDRVGKVYGVKQFMQLSTNKTTVYNIIDEKKKKPRRGKRKPKQRENS